MIRIFYIGADCQALAMSNLARTRDASRWAGLAHDCWLGEQMAVPTPSARAGHIIPERLHLAVLPSP